MKFSMPTWRTIAKRECCCKDATYIPAWQPMHGSQESSAAYRRGSFLLAGFLDWRCGREVPGGSPGACFGQKAKSDEREGNDSN